MSRSPQILSGLVSLAGFGLLVASGSQSAKQEAALADSIKIIPENLRLRHNQVRKLIYKLFPEAKSRKVSVKIFPHSASLEDALYGDASRAYVEMDAICSKLRIDLHYWIEGTPSAILMHEIGHMIDAYDAWVEESDEYDPVEYQAVDTGLMIKKASLGMFDTLSRGQTMVLEESAWDNVSAFLPDGKQRKLALDSYRHDRNASRLSTAGIALVVAGVASSGYSLAGKKNVNT